MLCSIDVRRRKTIFDLFIIFNNCWKYIWMILAIFLRTFHIIFNDIWKYIGLSIICFFSSILVPLVFFVNDIIDFSSLGTLLLFILNILWGRITNSLYIFLMHFIILKSCIRFFKDMLLWCFYKGVIFSGFIGSKLIVFLDHLSLFLEFRWMNIFIGDRVAACVSYFSINREIEAFLMGLCVMNRRNET